MERYMPKEGVAEEQPRTGRSSVMGSNKRHARLWSAPAAAKPNACGEANARVREGRVVPSATSGTARVRRFVVESEGGLPCAVPRATTVCRA